mgnify:CR=1 FL=1
MDYKKTKKILEDMTPKNREVTMIFYLKDIKDLLQTLLESKGIEPKHY